MAKVTETWVSYKRTIRMAPYGSLEYAAGETISVEEGEDASVLRATHYAILREEAKATLQPIYAEHRKQAEEFGKSKKPTQQGPKKGAIASTSASELPKQPELPEAATEVDKTTEEILDEHGLDQSKMGPVAVDRNGLRTRNTEEKSFTVNDIDRALVLLIPEGSKMDNPLRSDIRKWLLAGPLNPGFTDDLLNLAHSQYVAYRAEGATTGESIKQLLELWMREEVAGRIHADAGSSEETDDPATSEPEAPDPAKNPAKVAGPRPRKPRTSKPKK